MKKNLDLERKATERQRDIMCRLINEKHELLNALAQLVADWNSVPENVKVPDEINVDEHWDAARKAINKAIGPIK